MTRKNNCLLEPVTITRTTPRTCRWGLQCLIPTKTRKNNCLLKGVKTTRSTPRTNCRRRGCTLQCYLGGPRLIGALITDGGEGGPYPGKHINNTSIVKHINNTSTPKNREEKWKGSQTRTVLRKICCFLSDRCWTWSTLLFSIRKCI